MDILFLIITIFVTFITTIICAIAISDWTSSYSRGVFNTAFPVWFISASILTWTIIAIHNYNPSPIVTIHPIEVKYNTPYFFGPNNEVHELTGNSKFVDVEKFHIKWTVIPGDWKYGIYVSESVSWQITPKELPEATSH